MHTIQKIIKNQEDFREEILGYFLKEYSAAQKELNNIECNDDFILNEKQKLQQKFKKSNPQECINKLFFIHSKRNRIFYAWWDKDDSEAKIFKYG